MLELFVLAVVSAFEVTSCTWSGDAREHTNACSDGSSDGLRAAVLIALSCL